MSDLKDALGEMEQAISAAKWSFHSKLKAPATPADLSRLGEVLGQMPGDLSDWFGWHAGSPEGFIPETSVEAIGVKDAIRELTFLRENPPSQTLPNTFCPLLSDGGGGLWIWAQAAGGQAEIWEYDRGEILGREPFLGWVRHLRDLWLAERTVLRGEFVRIGRSLMGWAQVEIPLKAKKKVLASLRSLPSQSSFQVRAVVGQLRVGLAEAASWEVHEHTLELLLTQDGVKELLESLSSEDSAAVPGLPDHRISFSER